MILNSIIIPTYLQIKQFTNYQYKKNQLLFAYGFGGRLVNALY